MADQIGDEGFGVVPVRGAKGSALSVVAVPAR